MGIMKICAKEEGEWGKEPGKKPDADTGGSVGIFPALQIFYFLYQKKHKIIKNSCYLCNNP